MVSPAMKSSEGELFFAFLISAVAAVLAAVVRFFAGVLLPNIFLRGEATEAGLVLAPAMALIFGAVVFVFAFRKLSKYGESPDSPQ
jgi:hypothetical protein